MTMTPEELERAAEIWAAADLADTKSEAEAIIALAIREAEDAALERALAVAEEFCRMEKAMPGAQYESEAYEGMALIRDGISALKHNKD